MTQRETRRQRKIHTGRHPTGTDRWARGGNGAESRPATALTRRGRGQGAPWPGPHANARARRRGGRHGAAAHGRERAQAERARAAQRGGGAHPQRGRARRGGREQDGGERRRRTGARVGERWRRRKGAIEGRGRVSRWRGSFARWESGGGGATAGDCGSGRLGAEGAEEAEACGALGFGPREGEGVRFEVGRGERAARGKQRGGGGHTGRASGRRRAVPRGCPTGGCRGAGGAEGEADAWARARGRGRGGRWGREKERKATVQLEK
jgi:hypothetical protein